MTKLTHFDEAGPSVMDRPDFIEKASYIWNRIKGEALATVSAKVG